MRQFWDEMFGRMPWDDRPYIRFTNQTSHIVLGWALLALGPWLAALFTLVYVIAKVIKADADNVSLRDAVADTGHILAGIYLGTLIVAPWWVPVGILAGVYATTWAYTIAARLENG